MAEQAHTQYQPAVLQCNSEVICPISLPYEVSETCDTTKAGVEPRMYITAYCNLDTVHVDIPETKIIEISQFSDPFIAATYKESETDVIITGTLNDNDNSVESDEITGKGSMVDVAAFAHFRQFKNKLVCILLERSDGTWMCFGWDGGLKLREWKYETGKKQNDDFHGFTFKFDNKTRKTGRIVEPDSFLFPNGMDDLLALLLAA